MVKQRSGLDQTFSVFPSAQFAVLCLQVKSMISSSHVQHLFLSVVGPAALRAVPVWSQMMEQSHPCRRRPDFISRHQQFIEHFIYFSEAVASVSAKSSPRGAAEPCCSHKAQTEHSLAMGCQTWVIFKQMRLACGYSQLPSTGYRSGCSQRDFRSQMLPPVIRQVSCLPVLFQ